MSDTASKQNLTDLAKMSLASLIPAFGQAQAAKLPPSARTPDAMRALGVKNPVTQGVDPQIAAERAQAASELAQQNDATATDKKFFANQIAAAMPKVDVITHPDVQVRQGTPATPGTDVAQGEFGKKQMVLNPSVPQAVPVALPSSDQTISPDHTPNTDPELPGRDPTDAHIQQALDETPTPTMADKIVQTAKGLNIPIMHVLQAALAGYTAQKTGRPFDFTKDTIAGSQLARRQALEDQTNQTQAQADAQQRQFDFAQSMAAEQQRFAQETQAAQASQNADAAMKKAAEDHQNRLAEMKLEYSLAGKNQLAAIAAGKQPQATAGAGPFDQLVR